MCGNFALWYVICFRRGDQWSPFLVHSIISVLFFRRGSADDVHFSRIISYDGLLDKATTPPFRHLSSRRGLVRLPLRGAVSTADCGVAFGTSRCRSLRSPTASDSLSHTKAIQKR